MAPSDSDTSAPRAARTGGRSARVVQDAYAATLALLAEVGYDALRMEEVAERAGVHKTSLYRRWPTKVALVLGAVRSLFSARTAPPDTGSLEADLGVWLGQVVGTSATSEAAMRARMLVMGIRDPEFREEALKARKESQGRMLVVVERAIARGELPPTTDGAFLLDALISPLIFRLQSGQPVDLAYVDRLIRLLLNGARHPA